MSATPEVPQVVGSNVLYYPYMNAPRVGNRWFTEVLLYWDKVYLIVPYAMRGRLKKHTYSLVREGLVECIDPYHFLRDGYFEYKFIKLVESLQPAPRQGKWSHLHRDKMQERLYDELEHRNLVRPSEDEKGPDSDWIEVRSKTAHLYMTLLATYLSQTETLRSTPITNSPALLNETPPGSLNASRFFTNEETGDGAKLLTTFTIELQDALPVPKAALKAHDIADFKRAHKAELDSLKLAINTELFAILQMSPPRPGEFSYSFKRLKVPALLRLKRPAKDVAQCLDEEGLESSTESIFLAKPQVIDEAGGTDIELSEDDVTILATAKMMWDVSGASDCSGLAMR